VEEDRVPPSVGIHRDRSNLNDSSERLLREAIEIAERIEAHNHWVVTSVGADVGPTLSAGGLPLFNSRETVGGSGQRAARIDEQGKRTARKARGSRPRSSTESYGWSTGSEGPTIAISTSRWLAPSALLVANPHKIAEPVDSRDELKGKDALDILRPVRAVPIEWLAEEVPGENDRPSGRLRSAP
jgi:hypothetical protein